MIQVYSKGTVKPTGNGDMTLWPTECKVTADLNGAWVMEMTHPLDPTGRWKYITEESIISAPTWMGDRQLFRVDEVKKTDDEISVRAYPIFIDAGKEVFLLDARPTNKNGQEALDIILEDSIYNGKSDIKTTSTAYFERRNALDVINGTNEPTFVQRWGGEILYDNYTIIINKQVGGNYGTEIRYGKNMNGLQYTVDMSNVVTRIIPVAYNGRMIQGNMPWMDSKNINKYATPYIKEMKFENVKLEEDLEGAAGEDDIVCSNQEELEEKLKQLCNEQYELQADVPAVTMEVNMVMLENTTEYENIKMLEKVSLGDTVKCRHKKLDVITDARVIHIKWDCIKNRVSGVKLGSYEDTYFSKIDSVMAAVEKAIKDNGDVRAEKIKGVMNAIDTQLKYQKNIAQRQDVRAILFEDTDPESSTYGAMCLGTQGFQIADKRTQDGREWDWSTAFTAKGGYANVMILGILADKTGKNWWNLETGDIQMSGRFQQYASNGVKSMDIFDNKINLYAWDDDGNYVGSLRSFLTTDKKRKGIELMGDAGDQVRLSVKRSDTATEEGRSVFIGENGYTGLFTVDGKGNAEEWLSRKHGGPVWIRNMPNGDFLAGGVRIGVESGLITSIPSNSVANGTFEVISGLSWANGGITSVDWVKVNVSNGAIKSWSTRTQNF